MLGQRLRASFASEACVTDGIPGASFGDELQRDYPSRLHVARAEDRTHATPPEQLFDAVVPDHRSPAQQHRSSNLTHQLLFHQLLFMPEAGGDAGLAL
jgi:hypothetical protein